MKRILACTLCVLFLVGCAADHSMDRAMELRQQLLSSQGCSFKAEIMADYGDMLYSFSLACLFDELGDMTFTVAQPESISGITGKIEGEQGFLTFDDKAVSFPLLADGQLTPVGAPWIILKSLRSGYIHSSTEEGEQTYVCIDDSFEEDALQVELWLNNENVPVQAEILYKNCRILSLTIKDFTYV